MPEMLSKVKCILSKISNEQEKNFGESEGELFFINSLKQLVFIDAP